jgi:hypothetical protein
MADAHPTPQTGFVEASGGSPLVVASQDPGDQAHQPSIVNSEPSSFSYFYNQQSDIHTPSGSPGGVAGPFTISAWFKETKVDAPGATYFFEGSWASNGKLGWSLQQASDHLNLRVGSATIKTSPGTALPANQTVYLTVVYDGNGNWRVGENGVTVGSGTAAWTPNGGVPYVYIDSQGPGGWSGYGGYLENVAIWNVPLTPAEDAAFYEDTRTGAPRGTPPPSPGPSAPPGGTPPPAPGPSAAPGAHTALSANAFLDSIGMNSEFTYYGSVYDTHFSTVVSQLQSLGVHHIRDGLTRGDTDPTFVSRMRTLGAAGIKASLVIDLIDPKQWDDPTVHMQQNIANAPANYPNMDQFESPNELDLLRGLPTATTWIDYERTLIPKIYNAIKSNPATASFPLAGPSLTRNSAYCALGDLSASLDYGNIHDYLYGSPPEWSDLVTNPCLSDDWTDPYDLMLKAERMVSGPTKPVEITETGTCTGTTGGLFQVNPYTQQAYVPRTFLAAFLVGIKRVYYFNFADDPGFNGNLFGYCGIVDQNAVPKPAYYTLAGFIAALSAPGNASGGSLAYSLDRGSSALFQRGDGSYAIVVWNPAQTYCFFQVDANQCNAFGFGGKDGPITVAPLSATLSFTAPHTVDVTTFNPTTGIPVKQSLGKISSTPLTVTPVVQVLIVSP